MMWEIELIMMLKCFKILENGVYFYPCWPIVFLLDKWVLGGLRNLLEVFGLLSRISDLVEVTWSAGVHFYPLCFFFFDYWVYYNKFNG